MPVKYLEVPVEEFGTVKVRVESDDEPINTVGGFEELGIQDEIEKVRQAVVVKASKGFEQVSDTICTLACGFRQAVTRIEESKRPDEVSVEFGLAFNIKAGVVVTGLWESGGGGEGNFKVTMSWKEKQLSSEE
ncbi:hypothetical protein GF376_01340 [Candidatus Peregrinibacteria bacterium]|nr:hypothetical protein [Candidatus Peregrinibacteria bacterium]